MDWFNGIKNYLWGMFIYSEKTYAAKILKLRQEYYSHLSFLDELAKLYGELSFISKIFLYCGVIAINAFSFLNPFVLVIGCSLLFLLQLLSVQFNAMENRFVNLVQQMEVLEKSALQDSTKMQKEFKIIRQQNLELKTQIQENLEEMRQLKEELQKANIKVRVATQKVESSVNQFHHASSFFSEKIKTFASSAGELEDLEKQETSIEETDAFLKNSREFRLFVVDFLKKNGVGVESEPSLNH